MKIANILPLYYSNQDMKAVQLIHLLAEGLVEIGHHVTIFTDIALNTRANIQAVPLNLNLKEYREDPTICAIYIAKAIKASLDQGHEIIHNFDLGYGIALSSYIDIPTITTLFSSPPTYFCLASKLFSRNHFVFFSHFQEQLYQPSSSTSLIYNAIDLAQFSLYRDKDDYLVIMGDWITPSYEVELVLQAVKMAGKHLKIVGAVDPRYFKYFMDTIKPYLGEVIEYKGTASATSKKELVAKAEALIIPSSMDDLIGTAAIEAMACGTPVITLAKGSTSEIIKVGSTGFIASSLDELLKVFNMLEDVDPINCRLLVEKFFSRERFISDYMALYKERIQAISGQGEMSHENINQF